MFTGLSTGVDNSMDRRHSPDRARRIFHSFLWTSKHRADHRQSPTQRPSRYPTTHPALYTIPSTWARFFHRQQPRVFSRSSTELTRPTPTPTTPNFLFLAKIYKRRVVRLEHNGSFMLGNQRHEVSIRNTILGLRLHGRIRALGQDIDRTGKGRYRSHSLFEENQGRSSGHVDFFGGR